MSKPGQLIHKCEDCEVSTEEDHGRWLILDEEQGTEFNWMFLCIQCVRNWRARGLSRESLSIDEIEFQLDKEYPLI